MTICETKSCNENKKAIEALQKKVEELEKELDSLKSPAGITLYGRYQHRRDGLRECWVVAHGNISWYRDTVEQFNKDWYEVPASSCGLPDL